MNWLSTLTSLPAEYLKTAGTLLGGAFLAVGTYVLARLKEARRPADAAAGGAPRISLSPEDRDLAYLLARTGTDLTRALHEHGDLLRNGGGCPGLAPASTRPRPRPRTRPERPQP